jgi:hypothetical protein
MTSDNLNYEQISDPYNASLNRVSSATVPNGQFSSDRGNGNVETRPVKSDGAMADVWIQNFIRSENWNPKKNGFYIDGKTGYAEFSNVFVSGNIQALSGTIGGFTIGATELSVTSGSYSTVISSGSYSFASGPTGNPSFYVTIDGNMYASSATISGTITGSTITGGTITGATVSSSSSSSKITMNASTDSINFSIGGTEIAQILSYSSGGYSGIQIKLDNGTANFILSTSGATDGRAYVGSYYTSILFDDATTTNHLVSLTADRYTFGAGPSGQSLVDLQTAGMLLVPYRSGATGGSWTRPSTYGPSDPNGIIYYDTNADKLMVRVAGTWRTVTTS